MEDKTATVDNRERPLVTFALFTYNQERFVQEAIEAAFAQTYEPLEIIFSDDCSSDKTFDLLQEAAQSYKGPHSVSVRQTPNNLGTLLHVASVAKVSKGDFFVLAAGDDISKPNRVERLAKQLMSTGAWGVFSKFDRINDKGEISARNQESLALMSPNYRLREFFYKDEGDVQIIHGGTSAYDKRIFQYLSLTSDDYVLSEDGVLSVLLNLLGKKITKIDDSLVFYRVSDQSLTNSTSRTLSFASIKNAEIGIERLARSQENRCNLFLRLHELLDRQKVRRLNESEVTLELKMQRVLARPGETTFLERLRHLLLNLNSRNIRWILPRLLGLKAFFVAKFVSNWVLYIVRSK